MGEGSAAAAKSLPHVHRQSGISVHVDEQDLLIAEVYGASHSQAGGPRRENVESGWGCGPRKTSCLEV